MIRRVVGVVVALVGLVVAVVGGAAAFWLIGPDNTVHSGEQTLSSKGLAIASTPELLNRNGPVLHVDVRSTKNQPVFVGVARDFDVTSYLNGVGHTKLVQVQYPIALSTEDEKGTAGPLTAPATLDWWVAKADGTGTQSIAWPIEDGPYDVVIMNADGKTPPDVQVNLGIELTHAFTTALAVFAIGIVLLALGILLILLRKRTTKPKPPQSTPVQHGDSTSWQPNAYPPPYADQPTQPQRPPRPAGQQPPAQQQPPRTGGGTARRLSLAGLVLGLMLGLVSGCAAVPPADTAQTLTRPAISHPAAAAAIKHYDEVSNAAIKRRDGKLIATVETGELLRQSQAGYKIDGVLDKTGKARPDPTTRVKPSVGVPTYGGYPMYFVSSAGLSAYKDYRALDLWERKTAGSPWLMRYSLLPEVKVKLPPLEGLRPITAADNAKLAVSPAAAAAALAEYLNVGAQSRRATLFAPSDEVTHILSAVADGKSLLKEDPKSYRAAIDTFRVSGTPTAFLTGSGEALVFLSLTDEFQLQVGAGLSIFWAQGSPGSAYSPPTTKYNSAITSTTLYQVALVIPKKGAKLRVLSTSDELVEAGGY
ncbi:MAG TPA: hypothetical protein VGL05_13050 [Kribbella sp.]